MQTLRDETAEMMIEGFANILIDAVLNVETRDSASIAFICHGATHRSVGMSYLLMVVVYKHAFFRPYTARVDDAARAVFQQREDGRFGTGSTLS